MLLNRLREELRAAARAAGQEPLEPLLVVESGQLISPRLRHLALPELDYAPEVERILTGQPRHEVSRRFAKLFQMARDQGIPERYAPLAHPDEQRLEKLIVWTEDGLIPPEKLLKEWNLYYEKHPILEPGSPAAPARVALSRAAQIVLGGALREPG